MSKQTDFEEIKRLKERNRTLKREANLWHKRVDEAAETVKDFEELQAENRLVKNILYSYKVQFSAAMKATTLGLCKKAIKHAVEDEKALGVNYANSCDEAILGENKRLKKGIIDDKDTPMVLVPRELFEELQALKGKQ